MSGQPFTHVTTAAELDGAESPGGIILWALRFCQTPETFPVFMEWCRSIWPGLPYSDREVAEDLSRSHDFIRRVLERLPSLPI